MPPELTLTVHHRSDAGRVRTQNQDYLGYRQPQEAKVRAEAGWLYAVADGVGGAQAGEVASKLAVQTLLTAYYRTYGQTPAERLQKAFAEANGAVYEQASQQEGPRRMSTTLVAAVIRGKELSVANVGDSRAYLVRNGQMRQITRDHSVVAELMAEGVITPEQAEHHPQRKTISRSIGARPKVEADVFTEIFHPGDRLLLCSDGLTEHVADTEILSSLQIENPEEGVRHLLDLANEGGGTDNITVLVVRALGEGEKRLPSLAPPEEAKEKPPSQRVLWPWIGAVVTILLICIAGLAAGAVLLFRPTPTPTATPTLIPVLATSTATTITIPTPTYPPTTTPLPTSTDTATPLPTDTPSPTATSTDTPSSTPTATESPIPTNTPSPTVTATQTVSPTSTETLTPTPVSTETLTPTATSTSETSPLPTPTLTPTPTNTSQISPLPTPP